MNTKLTQTPDISNNRTSMNFIFNYSLTQKVMRNCRFAYDHLGDLTISFTARKAKYSNSSDPIEEQYMIDIQSVCLEGQDIPFALLTYTGLIEELEQAALHHVAICEYSTEVIPLENTPTYTRNNVA